MKKFKPSKIQEEFLKSTKKVRLITWSGKSDYDLIRLLKFATFEEK